LTFQITAASFSCSLPGATDCMRLYTELKVALQLFVVSVKRKSLLSVCVCVWLFYCRWHAAHAIPLLGATCQPLPTFKVILILWLYS